MTREVLRGGEVRARVLLRRLWQDAPEHVRDSPAFTGGGIPSSRLLGVAAGELFGMSTRTARSKSAALTPDQVAEAMRVFPGALARLERAQRIHVALGPLLDAQDVRFSDRSFELIRAAWRLSAGASEPTAERLAGAVSDIASQARTGFSPDALRAFIADQSTRAELESEITRTQEDRSEMTMTDAGRVTALLHLIEQGLTVSAQGLGAAPSTEEAWCHLIAVPGLHGFRSPEALGLRSGEARQALLVDPASPEDIPRPLRPSIAEHPPLDHSVLQRLLWASYLGNDTIITELDARSAWHRASAAANAPYGLGEPDHRAALLLAEHLLQFLSVDNRVSDASDASMALARRWRRRASAVTGALGLTLDAVPDETEASLRRMWLRSFRCTLATVRLDVREAWTIVSGLLSTAEGDLRHHLHLEGSVPIPSDSADETLAGEDPLEKLIARETLADHEARSSTLPRMPVLRHVFERASRIDGAQAVELFITAVLDGDDLTGEAIWELWRADYLRATEGLSPQRSRHGRIVDAAPVYAVAAAHIRRQNELRRPELRTRKGV
jgi:hypothetical protein